MRLFDDTLDLDSVRSMSVRLEIRGADGFHLDAVSDTAQLAGTRSISFGR